jgi:hypothetical protein
MHKFELSITHHNGQCSYHITHGVDAPGTLIGEFDTLKEAQEKEAEERKKDEAEEFSYWENYRKEERDAQLRHEEREMKAQIQ